MDQLTNAKFNTFVGVILSLIIVLSVGCAIKEAAVSDIDKTRQIVDITIDEDTDSLILGIQGNQKLDHKEERQGDPQKIALFFPATGLDRVTGRFVPPDNEIIRSIIAGEHVENETTNSTIYIVLKLDSPYAIAPDKDGLLITFPKNSSPPNKTTPPQKKADNKPEPQLAKPAQKSMPDATTLRSVTTETLENTVAVNLIADGTIKNYKAFTMVNPDRIVFDIYNIKSPHHKEQKIAVQSKWIKQIRYFGHPNKLRLVIDTLNHAASKYSSVSTDTGLIIHVSAK